VTNKQHKIDIEHWPFDHSRWSEWQSLAEQVKLGHIIEGCRKQQILEQTYCLAGLIDQQIVGLLLFVVQPIGPEMDIPMIKDGAGNILTEAKIRAFEVLESYQRRGVGTALQQETLAFARELGCYQVRSRSELDKTANYSIKMKLGFGMHPAFRVFDAESKSAGVYWVKAV